MNCSKIVSFALMMLVGLSPSFAFADSDDAGVGTSLSQDDTKIDSKSDMKDKAKKDNARIASAQDDRTGRKEIISDPDPNTRYKIGEGEEPAALPPPRSTNEPPPPVAAPSVPKGGVVKQAGIGGQTAYARAGVLELGGAAFFNRASDFTQLALNPSIGWFFMDDFQLSLILSLAHLSTQGVSSTFVSGLVEPSVHIPFSETVFGMAGLGLGPSWGDGPGWAFALAPRIGVQFLLGRSGILTPSFQLMYSTHEAIATPQGTLLAVNLTYGAGIGYTVMW